MRRGAAPPRPRVEFVPWKPDVCEEPGCTARHPSFSRDGMAGPWRCREHDLVATKRPADNEFLAATPAPKKQDRLL